MFETTWRSPSNIAFVKYWGKKGHQIPANPSVSMTLKECYTQTTVRFSEDDTLKVKLFLDGVEENRFAKKIQTYLENLALPELKTTSLHIETHNTFPHGTGIASSASGLSAFALCLTDFLYHLNGQSRGTSFTTEASHYSRLASGSACRSVFGGFATWGKYDAPDSSDLHASPLSVHETCSNLLDTVLIISDEEKKVSSRSGHEKMNEHAYAKIRFLVAEQNFHTMLKALKTGDLETMGLILENEALQLHAMMMTSPDAFMLMRPNTLSAIELVRDFREQTKIPLYFTLDAGPNLHLIYPDTVKAKVMTFITHELSPLTSKIIEDGRGEGPVKCL
jgi:diphosphomevalonate decarboxylase